MLIEGCVTQIADLAALVLMLAIVSTPTASMLALVLTIFGYGQGLVLYGTTAQIANAIGVAVIGAVFFAIDAAYPAQDALFAAIAMFVVSIMTAVAFLFWMRRAIA